MNKDHNEVWKSCLSIIRDNIPAPSFRTWFIPIQPLKLERNVLTIQVPSPFFYEYLEEHFIDILRKTIRKELGKDAMLEYNVVMDNTSTINSKPYTVKLPAKDNVNLQNRPVSLPLVSDIAIKNPFVIPGIKKVHVNPQLNPVNTFGNFVEGDCNRLSRSAGYAVANNPGKTAFNPLFLYGPSGLGKTHLAQAIGIEVKNRFQDKTVLYVAANKFITQFSESTRSNTRNDFLHFYQMIDVLIIDDVQDFAGKEKSQDTFFHIFNQLHQSGKQLILTSDRSPIELNGLSKRLISRFKWGLSADLQVPDYSTRLSILKQKLYNDGIELEDQIIEYVASNITTNVRELEGALVSLLAQSTLNKKTITIELAKKIIDNLVKNTKREITIEYIQKVVCDYFDMNVDVLQSKTRKREIVQARQIAMFFSKNLTSSSLSTIGSQIGGKDHATVLHAYKTVNNLAETNKEFKEYIKDIEKKLKVF
ncbi:MAG: chromosomal replication initiator protein DnaA [Bacteroidales bacterium]|nr:chromosomal replication initiator protein DnaA [Bacteroidales bacterium]MBN2756817.1 chromosomal replication initiator protein DnaA [Bacteroidales bacterium]